VEVRKKRADRYLVHTPVQDAVARGIPISASVYRRLTPLRQALAARLEAKIARVEQRLKISGQKQLDSWRLF